MCNEQPKESDEGACVAVKLSLGNSDLRRDHQSVLGTSGASRIFLSQYGRPAIVLAAIDVSQGQKMDPAYPALSSTLLRSNLGKTRAATSFLDRQT
jgi:hypothetical protein